MRIKLLKNFNNVIAMGSEMKNTVCSLRGSEMYISPSSGDIRGRAAYEKFLTAVRWAENSFLDKNSFRVACDLHPDYLSTKYALGRFDKSRVIHVQHHYAHMLSVMAEYGHYKKAAGLILDGMGYGDDGGIWGGELLVADLKGYKRTGHLEYIKFSGGDKLADEPYRTLYFYALQYGLEERLMGEPVLSGVNRNYLKIIKTCVARDINVHNSSSCGRLFDAVGALVLNKAIIRRGELLPSLLESEAVRAGKSSDAYDTKGMLIQKKDKLIISAGPLLEKIFDDHGKGTANSTISAKFHNSLIEVFYNALVKTAAAARTDTVVLSGGCFLNSLLREGLFSKLVKKGYRVLTSKSLPAGDENISAGQALYAGSHK